jgi:hypothetical protein
MQLAMAVRRHIVASGFSLLIIASQTHDTANALIGADIADISLRQYTVAVASMKGRCTGRGADAGYRAHRLCAGASNLRVGGNRGFGDPASPPVGLSPLAEVVLHPLYDKKDAGSHDLSLLKARQAAA